MSVLTNKQILIVGTVVNKFKELETELAEYGMAVHYEECHDFEINKIRNLKIDLVVLNLKSDNGQCVTVLDSIRHSSEIKPLPVLVLIDDSNVEIQNSYAHGATDFIIESEKNDSILQKINAIFNTDSEFEDAPAIDISTPTIQTTTTGIRVFVVEDDPLLRNLLSLRLERSSFPHEFSNDGKDIIIALNQFKPDIVILDLMLPGKSGFDVLSEIKNDKNLNTVPVMVFSNRDGAEDRQKAKELGAEAFYVKAMTDLSELVNKIELLTR